MSIISPRQIGYEPYRKILSHLDFATLLDLICRLVNNQDNDNKTNELIQILCLDLKILNSPILYYNNLKNTIESFFIFKDTKFYSVKLSINLCKDYHLRFISPNMFNNYNFVAETSEQCLFFKHKIYRVFGNLIKKSNKPFLMSETVIADILKIKMLNEIYMEHEYPNKMDEDMENLISELDTSIQTKMSNKSFYEQIHEFEMYSTLGNLNIVNKLINSIINSLDNHLKTRILHTSPPKYRNIMRNLLEYKFKISILEKSDLFESTINWLNEQKK